MKKRPLSVTVIAWIILVVSALSLTGSLITMNGAATQEVMAKSPLPILTQDLLLYVGLIVEILCAVFMLRAANWARLLYIGWGGLELLVLLITSPERGMLIPGVLMYVIFVFFLLRPKASAYFARSSATQTE